MLALRRTTRVAALVALVVAVAGCDWLPIPGDGPLRYRDEVFDDVVRTADVEYGTAVEQDGDTITLLLDVYEPEGDTASARPLIVFVHGGSFRAGNKSSPEIVDQARLFARKGYVTASINYRLSANGCTSVTAECLRAIADARADAQDALRFLRAHADDYGIDTERVAIAGTSAGAITALGVAYIEAPDEEAQVRAAISLSGAVIANGSVDDDDPNSVLFHGTNDPLVPYAWAQNTVAAAEAVGLKSYLVTWEGEGHVPYVPHRDQILNITTNVLYRWLDVEHAPQ